jgi:hypothetical protein
MTSSRRTRTRARLSLRALPALKHLNILPDLCTSRLGTDMDRNCVFLRRRSFERVEGRKNRLGSE